MTCALNYQYCWESKLEESSSSSSEERHEIVVESDNFRQRASRLRQEALELEQQIRNSTSPEALKKVNVRSATPKYRDMKDTVWTLSYLFASQPEPKGSKLPKDNTEENKASSSTRFGGKLTLRFKADGYTDFFPSESEGVLKLVKVWGWDLETSTDDDMEYLVFSIDVLLPGGSKERYYMQAKLVKSHGEISLTDGTVTVKQDATETGSRWGLFTPKGILAEFRYVGNFVAKPSVLPP